ncbi:MAG: AgmX/PglI C-terminal domain-containing protein [Proteobacteria bacterium]|nr:AgmX/PglI C-terminal domain-containing protein [Pseudomonadota bacterium]
MVSMSAQPATHPATQPGMMFDFPLPWALNRSDRRKLRSWLISLLATTLVLGVIIPWLPLPEPPREELEQLPPELARIVLEKPLPVIPKPPPEPKVVEAKPEPEMVKQVPKEVTTPKPQPTVADAREKAAVSGLLAFKDAFSDMRDAIDTSKLTDTQSIQRGAGEAASIDRSLLTSKQSTRSSGVNVAALSSDTGGIALAGRETTKVEAPEGSKGEGGVRDPKDFDPRQRSIEEIRRVFDANKGAIFAIYNRALRQDPTLLGKLVVNLVIDPDGMVVDCAVVDSDLADETMIAKILSRIRMFDFGKRDVRVTSLNYPVHFLPT